MLKTFLSKTPIFHAKNRGFIGIELLPESPTFGGREGSMKPSKIFREMPKTAPNSRRRNRLKNSGL
jgi:hypothetical protein